ncbi:MAG: hypothetical protein KDA78_20900 [Planctomycetaceae bacterium]|nr:hypothetical protein [Planctomycetaceae bacterium]
MNFRLPTTLRHCRLFGVVALLLLTTTGCEVGRTMFQYSSGSTPWLGIDLVPQKKKKSVTTISDSSHPVREGRTSSRTGSIELEPEQEATETATLKKSPQRIDLPVSSLKLTSTTPSPAKESAGAAEIQF